MGEGRHPHQFAAPGLGLRHRAVDARPARRARQGLQHDRGAIQEEEPAAHRGRLARRRRACGRDVRAAVRQDYRCPGTDRRRQRAGYMSMKKQTPRSPSARDPLVRGSAVEPIRWKGDRVEFLDQRLLPDQTVYVTCRTAAEVAAAIRDMVVRGAPAIGCAAAFGVALSGGSAEAYEILGKSRPTAVNLFWALARMKTAKDLKAEAQAIFAEDLAANHAMGKLGAELIPDRARVMTHCNAGALATAGYGTALGVIRSSKHKNISVIANETRPYLQGARLTAYEMVQEGIPCTLITDSMAGHLMSQDRKSVV